MKSRLTEILERIGGESRIRYSLERFTQALNAAGSPHETAQTLVIGGTNGKGTVSLLLSSTLSLAGYRTATFLSPHLQHPEERFLNNLQPIAPEDLEALAVEYEPFADRFELTYFEFLTLLCFCWVRKVGFDFLVLEVGMGGRLDATNVTQPRLTAITTIDWDHQRFLGNTLDAILTEKMGILRSHTPVFSGLEGVLREQLDQRCQQIQAFLAPPPPQPLEVILREDGQQIRLEASPFILTNPSEATSRNAALAYQILRKSFPQIPVQTIQKGFARVLTPGRFETVQRSPRVILSGDHNPAGIESLLRTLQALKTRPRIVAAFSPDKPAKQMVERLRSQAQSVRLTVIDRFRNQMPDDYFALAGFTSSAVMAVKEELLQCSPDDTLVITGSLYLVGEVRPLWQNQVAYLKAEQAEGS